MINVLFAPSSLMKANSAQYSEVFIIHLGHGRDTSLHAQCVFRGLVIFVPVDDVLLVGHPPILTKSQKKF